MKKEYDERNKYREVASAKMGELMLAGWTLLGAMCPNTSCGGMPLMSLQGGPMKCVVCEREYTLDANEDIKLITETLAEAKTESASTATAQTNDDNDIKDDEFYLMDAPVLSAYRNDNANDASARIAKYLVEGRGLAYMFLELFAVNMYTLCD